MAHPAMMLPSGVVKQLTAPKKPKGKVFQSAENAARFARALPGAVVETVDPYGHGRDIARTMVAAPVAASNYLVEDFARNPLGATELMAFINSEDPSAGVPQASPAPAAAAPVEASGHLGIPPRAPYQGGMPDITRGLPQDSFVPENLRPAVPAQDAIDPVAGEQAEPEGPAPDPRSGAFQTSRDADGTLRWQGGGAAAGSAKEWSDADRASMLSSLKANQPRYLEELPRSGVRHIVDGEFGAPDRVSFEEGTVPTRAQSAAEDNFAAMQVQQATDRDARLDQARAVEPYRPEVAELVRHKEYMDAQNALIQAAADAQMLEEIGLPATEKSVEMLRAIRYDKQLATDLKALEEGRANGWPEEELKAKMRELMLMMAHKSGKVSAQLQESDQPSFSLPGMVSQ